MPTLCCEMMRRRRSLPTGMLTQPGPPPVPSGYPNVAGATLTNPAAGTSSCLTEVERVRKTAATARGRAPNASESMISTHKHRERKTFCALIAGVNSKRDPLLPWASRTSATVVDFPSLEKRLGARSVVTPATGNCLAMAIAQVAADSTLDGSDPTLFA